MALGEHSCFAAVGAAQYQDEMGCPAAWNAWGYTQEYACSLLIALCIQFLASKIRYSRFVAFERFRSVSDLRMRFRNHIHSL